MRNNRALVLLSGGLDSATTAGIAINDGMEVSAMTFAYGQRHRIEISYAKRLAKYFKILNHQIVEIPVNLFSGSALTSNFGVEVPKNREITLHDAIPATYVPARNILFLSYALAYSESYDISNIYIGVNSIDYSGYPDCRPEFISAFERMANLGTKKGVEGEGFRIVAPLINLKKWEIINIGVKLGVDYSLTHSCYDPDEDGLSCGECDSCKIRRNGFFEANVIDPTRYKKR